MATSIEKSKRTVSGETMTSVLKFIPKDGFKLSDKALNKIYTCTSVDEYDATDSIKAFTTTLEDEEGNVIMLSSSAIKRSRVLNKSTFTASGFWKKCKSILLRSSADDLWNNSQFFHAAFKLRKDEDFTFPERIKLRYAVLFEERGSNKPLLSSYMYEGFSRLVKEYSASNKYPSMDDFRMELQKDVKERLPFLPVGMTEPTPYSWCSGDVSEFRHILVWERV